MMQEKKRGDMKANGWKMEVRIGRRQYEEKRGRKEEALAVKREGDYGKARSTTSLFGIYRWPRQMFYLVSFQSVVQY